MKQCPKCHRIYTDETLNFCLDDGEWLREVSGSDEPATVMLNVEEPTRRHSASSRVESPANVGLNRNSFIAGVIGVLFVTALGVGGYWLYGGDEGKQIESVAVLPLQNRSGDAETDYLSDGLADSLIYRLSQVPGLRVSPTSSVIRYKGKEIDVREVAKELDVDAVMSGRLMQRGNDLSVSVQLTDARSNKLIWAEQYERKMSDLLATQREIATNIAQKLELKLSGTLAEGITRKYTDNNEAYQLYLKGRFYFAKRTRGDILRSVELYRQAIDLDPDFAQAYVGLADSHVIMPAFGYASPNDSIPQAKSAIRRALEIAPDLSEAHAVNGYVLGMYDRNWAESEREFKRAIDLDTNAAMPRHHYGFSCLNPTGRFDEAISELKKALEIEPLSVNIGADFAAVYMNARKNELAVEQANKTILLEPDHPTARAVLAMVQVAAGSYAEAISACEATLTADPNNQDCLQMVGYAFAKTGRREEAEEVIRKFEEIGEKGYSVAYRTAAIYGLLGETDKAFAELEKSLAARDWDLSFIKVDPFMDPLRNDPRFPAMLKRLNLSE